MHLPSALVLTALCAPATALGGDCVFEENDGIIIVEFESLDFPHPWVEETDVNGYVGDSYIRWSGGNHYNDPGNGVFEVDILAHTGGDYWFAIRNHHDHQDPTEENDVWVSLDGGPWVKTFSNEAFQWTYTTWFDYGHGNMPPAEFNLTPGYHTIRFSGRSFNFRMDRFHLFKDGHADWHNENAPNPSARATAAAPRTSASRRSTPRASVRSSPRPVASPRR